MTDSAESSTTTRSSGWGLLDLDPAPPPSGTGCTYAGGAIVIDLHSCGQ
nr:hypothetical protein [Rhodococcus qingshengii]